MQTWVLRGLFLFTFFLLSTPDLEARFGGVRGGGERGREEFRGPQEQHRTNFGQEKVKNPAADTRAMENRRGDNVIINGEGGGYYNEGDQNENGEGPLDEDKQEEEKLFEEDSA